MTYMYMYTVYMYTVYMHAIYIFIACYHVVAMCYILHIGSYRPVYNFPVSQTL